MVPFFWTGGNQVWGWYTIEWSGTESFSNREKSVELMWKIRKCLAKCWIKSLANSGDSVPCLSILFTDFDAGFVPCSTTVPLWFHLIHQKDGKPLNREHGSRDISEDPAFSNLVIHARKQETKQGARKHEMEKKQIKHPVFFHAYQEWISCVGNGEADREKICIEVSENRCPHPLSSVPSSYLSAFFLSMELMILFFRGVWDHFHLHERCSYLSGLGQLCFQGFLRPTRMRMFELRVSWHINI